MLFSFFVLLKERGETNWAKREDKKLVAQGSEVWPFYPSVRTEIQGKPKTLSTFRNMSQYL